MVEFALALPIFLLIVFGMIDMCRYFFQYQSTIHTLRSAARYAVTGQLRSNPLYNPLDTNSFPYLTRRESIIQAAKDNNPAGIPISVVSSSNYNTNDQFIIQSGSNINGPWTASATNATMVVPGGSGTGGSYMRLELKSNFTFVTPFFNLMAYGVSGTNPGVTPTNYIIRRTLIMIAEGFSTNSYPPTNTHHNTNNYWN